VKSPLIVPGNADFDSVSPHNFLTFSIASTPSTAIATIGFDVIKFKSWSLTFSPRLFEMSFV